MEHAPVKANRIDHIAIVVKDVAKAVETYENNFGFKADASRGGEAPEMNAERAFVAVGGIDLEFIRPLGDQGPLAEFAERVGEGTFAIAIEVENIDEAVRTLRENGLDAPEPRNGAVFLPGPMTHGVPMQLFQKP